MIRETYDPILHLRSGWRLRFTPLRSPRAGTALVLQRGKDDYEVVTVGNPPPRPWAGGCQACYLVDMTPHALTFAVQARSADPWKFDVTFRLECRVVDPEALVRSGRRDMAEAVYESMARVVGTVAPRFRVSDADQVRVDILDIVRDPVSPDGCHFSLVGVDVDVVDGEDLRAVQRDLFLKSISRTTWHEVASGTRHDMLAHYMAINDGDPTSYLQLERDARDNDARANLELMKVLLESGKLSAAESSKITRQVLDRLVPDSPRGRSGHSRDAIRGGARGAIDGGMPVIDPAGQHDVGDDRGRRGPRANP